MGPEHSERETAILDAALDLVSEVGFDRMSMDAVAARAHASKATIYRHWDGKAQLVVDAMRCRVGVDEEPPATGSLRSDLLATLGLMAEAMTGVDGRLMMGLVLAKERDPELSRLLREQLHDAKRPLWQAICDRAVAAGELTDPEVAVAALEEVAPGMAFLQHAVLGLPLDEQWRIRIVDTVLLPLLGALSPAARQPA
jgi:AcrR family transcriptional regulator